MYFLVRMKMFSTKKGLRIGTIFDLSRISEKSWHICTLAFRFQLYKRWCRKLSGLTSFSFIEGGMSKHFYLLLFMSRTSFINVQNYLQRSFSRQSKKQLTVKPSSRLFATFPNSLWSSGTFTHLFFLYLRTKQRFQNMYSKAFAKESTGELSLQTISALPMLLKCPEVYCTFIFCGLINLSTWRIYN